MNPSTRPARAESAVRVPFSTSLTRGLFAVLMCGAALLAGCAGLVAPHSIEVDRGRLERAIAGRFPFETRWLGAFDVTASTPSLRLLPDSNRIGTDLALTANDRVFGRTLRGAVAFDSALRFEPSDATLRLARVRVDRVAVDGLPEAASAQTGRLAALLVEQLLEGLPVYTLSASQQDTLRRAGVQPGDVRVTPSGLSIALQPVAR